MTHPLRFSANISLMFAEHEFLMRFSEAAKCQFRAVECHFPYEFAIADIKAQLEANDLVLNSINTAPGDMARKEFGFAAVPDRQDDFRRTFEQALEYATALQVPAIHCLSGHVAPDQHNAARDCFLKNMSWAAQQLGTSQIDLLIEPLNGIDRPGYFVSRSDEIIKLLNELGQSQVKLLFDVYHIQIMEGDLLRRLERHWSKIGHIQIASVPNRHEPDEGEIFYPAIFHALQARKWLGWIGAEYIPRGRTQDGLGWLSAWRN